MFAGSQIGGRPALAFAVMKEGDGLRLSVVGYLKVVDGQVGYRIAVVIYRHHVEVHHPRLLLHCRGIPGQRRQKKHRHPEKPKNDTHFIGGTDYSNLTVTGQIPFPSPGRSISQPKQG